MHQNLTSNIIFKKLPNDHVFIAEGDFSLIFEYAYRILKEITFDINAYVEDFNNRIIHDIITRCITSKFFKTVPILDTSMAVMIKFNYLGKEYSITAGQLPDPITGKIKYVDSIFIK